ncbi:MAG: hypothetical protein NTW04_05790, partial [Elusimicrobia bacterium]|nr:hypothetical protein [Elusimicrobiota bacterium]
YSEEYKTAVLGKILKGENIYPGDSPLTVNGSYGSICNPPNYALTSLHQLHYAPEMNSREIHDAFIKLIENDND